MTAHQPPLELASGISGQSFAPLPGSGAFLRDVFGLYFTPPAVIEAINPPPQPNIMDCICNPPLK